MPDISADHHASTGAPLPQHPFRSRSQCFTGTAVLSSSVPSFARSFDAADGILPHHLQFASSWHFASEVFRFKGQCSAHSQENPEPGLDRTPAPSHPTGLSPVLHALRYPRSVPRLKATKRSQKKKEMCCFVIQCCIQSMFHPITVVSSVSQWANSLRGSCHSDRLDAASKHQSDRQCTSISGQLGYGRPSTFPTTLDRLVQQLIF